MALTPKEAKTCEKWLGCQTKFKKKKGGCACGLSGKFLEISTTYAKRCGLTFFFIWPPFFFIGHSAY